MPFSRLLTPPFPGLPKFRGLNLRSHPDFPAVGKWLAAMEARPAYQRVRSDDQTLQVRALAGWLVGWLAGCLDARVHRLPRCLSLRVTSRRGDSIPTLPNPIAKTNPAAPLRPHDAGLHGRL
jgi:hypothetical protein